MLPPTKREKDPKVEKAAVLRAVELRLGPTTQAAPRRPDWRLSPKGTTSVFMTFSKDADLFYDVSETDLQHWGEYLRSFVIFIMGAADDVLVVPIEVLQDKVVRRMKSKERGNFKLHITGSSRLHFREVSHIDLEAYRNAFQLFDE